MDELDRDILRILQSEGRVTLADLAQRVGLSGPAAGERVRKLEQQGVIRGYAALVDPRAVGLGLLAFIGVAVDHPRQYAAFLQAMADAPEVLEVHHVAGADNYLVKVRCHDTEHLEQVIADVIKRPDGVSRTYTTVVLSSKKDSTALPL